MRNRFSAVAACRADDFLVVYIRMKARLWIQDGGTSEGMRDVAGL